MLALVATGARGLGTKGMAGGRDQPVDADFAMGLSPISSVAEAMITVGRVKIDRIPDYFMERYDGEIAAWAQNFEKIGPVKGIVLREGHLSNLSPDPQQGAVLIQVKLLARMSGRGVEIEPYTKRDETLIALHCEKMQRARMPSRGFTSEPARPWLPFMPDLRGKH